MKPFKTILLNNMKNAMLLLFLFLIIACSESGNNRPVKDTTSEEVNEISKAVGIILTTDDSQLSKEQLHIKSMIDLIMIDYLEIDTINKTARLTLTKKDCSNMKLPDKFHEFINGELEETLHQVDSMGLWKEWSRAYLDVQIKSKGETK